MAEARRRTLALIEPLSEEQLNRVYTPILSPLVWDLGHIANFEELWLVQRVGNMPPLHGDLGRFYDAIETPRVKRGELPILRGTECIAYMESVRRRTLEVLDRIDLDSEDPLLQDGFVYELIIAHEHQHNETMLQLIQMVESYDLKALEAAGIPGPGQSAQGPGPGQSAQASQPYDPPRESWPAGFDPAPDLGVLRHPGGELTLGAPDHTFAYDNERPRRTVELAPFLIDRRPVTNAEFAAFVDDTGAEPPMYWERDGAGGWARTAMGQTEPLDANLPVSHVDWLQATAFAEWAGKRLPTEAEWEAASLQLLGVGEVWEWTATEFSARPGFQAFPYREYSEPFFDAGYMVLKGGSWATCREDMRPAFRNWDLPERRQIFSGIRCARDE